jgi:uncharacterized protein (TIGR03792 family)
MVIEWLKFWVEPQAREKFIELDSQIWTQALAQYPGHLGKEVWISPQADDEVELIVKWQTREQWAAVPQDVLKATEEKFKAAMGSDRYELIEVREHHVRKFTVQENKAIE